MALADELEVPKRKRLKELGNKLSSSKLFWVGMASVLMVLCGYNLIDSNRRENLHNNLYNKVRLIANTDASKITDHEEWGDVYESLGLEYDIHASNPKKDLTVEQMREYLGIK